MANSHWFYGVIPDGAFTNDIYWAAQPPEVQRLRNMKDPERINLAKSLADRGFIIDIPIMAWNWDPLIIMMARKTAGYTWVPSANQPPVELGPGLSFPGMKEYDPNNPPAGSIKVSVLAEDYPPFVVVPPPPPPPTNKVGAYNPHIRSLDGSPAKYHDPGPGASSNGKYTVDNGEAVSEDGKSFIAEFRYFIGMPTLYFKLVE